jgi:two-component system, NtrC family, sensor kinase
MDSTDKNMTEKIELAAFLDDFPAMVWRTDASGQLDYCNNAWLSFTGQRLEDELGNGWLDRIYPEDFDLCLESVRNALAEKLCFRIEYRLRNFNMEFRWILHMGHPFNGPDGKLAGLIGTCYDTTESRQAQEMLSASEDYFRSFIESSKDCIAHISGDGNFLSINEAGARLNGFDSAEDMTNMNLPEMVTHGRDDVDEAIQRAASGQTFSIRYMTTDRSGNNRWWDAKLTPVIDFDSTVKSILLVSRDITEQKKAESALEQKNIELEKAYAELKAAQSQILQQDKMASVGQLAAGVAHEINNPMGFIISNINTLKKYVSKIWEFVSAQTAVLDNKPLSDGTTPSPAGLDEIKNSLRIDYIKEDIENLIAESLDGADRVKKIVQALKSFSRIDETEYKPADINSGIESTINIVWNELKYKVNLTRDYGDIPQTICNPGQLNQVFMNILVNAVNAIESHGDILVKTWSEDGWIMVLISDTGSGIPQDMLKRIFEPFFTTKEVGKGTGLGLSIAYDIIKKHNGDIKVESTVGRGSSFTISIPVVGA